MSLSEAIQSISKSNASDVLYVVFGTTLAIIFIIALMRLGKKEDPPR